MPFHNRSYELDDIRQAIASRRSELVVLYGRRGVGKSALIAEALRGQHHFFYQATTRTLPQQLEDLSSTFHAFAPDLVLPGSFSSFDSVLAALSQVARTRPKEAVVAVIDELPYLAQADPAVPSVMQRWWDEIRRDGLANLKLFLLGSMVSWMEEHTLSEHAPLHNRRTGQMRLEPLGYREAALFYPDYTPEERVAAFAVWGGMPSYLDEIDPSRSLWENVTNGMLRPSARLADEPSWLRFADLRSDLIYSSVLRAISVGKRRPSEIASAIGKQSAAEVIYHLDRLCDLGLVQRLVPIQQEGERRSRQSLYVLADNYVAFWYRYVDRLRHLLVVRRQTEALRQIQEDFHDYVSGFAFEDVCRQFIRMMDGRAISPKLSWDRVGSWWTGRNGGDGQDEMDVVATSEGRAVLVGECKWSVRPMDLRQLGGLRAALARAASDLRPIDRPWRALFSRSGFTDELLALAEDPEERVLLFTLAELYASPLLP